MIVQIEEQFLVSQDFLTPRRIVEALQFVELLLGEIEPDQ